MGHMLTDQSAKRMAILSTLSKNILNVTPPATGRVSHTYLSRMAARNLISASILVSGSLPSIVLRDFKIRIKP